MYLLHIFYIHYFHRIIRQDNLYNFCQLKPIIYQHHKLVLSYIHCYHNMYQQHKLHIQLSLWLRPISQHMVYIRYSLSINQQDIQYMDLNLSQSQHQEEEYFQLRMYYMLQLLQYWHNQELHKFNNLKLLRHRCIYLQDIFYKQIYLQYQCILL
jgi:hypothetical protein